MELSLFSTEGVTTFFKKLQFGNSKQLEFLEDLYTLINDGIPANRAVEMITKVAIGVPRDVALTMSQRIAQGQPLAEGMKEWFSPNVVELVRIGEAGGALAQTLKSAINMLSRRGVAVGALIAAIAYPMVVIIMACFMTVYLDKAAFSQFRMVKPESQWPAAGKRLVALSKFIQHWWWATIIAFVAIIITIRRIMTHYTGSFRPILDRYPPFLFYRRLVAARLLETLGLLVANGVVFKSALKTINTDATPYLHFHLDRMETLLGMGKSNIADVLDTGLVAPQDLMRLRVMAEVKGFEHGLVRMGLKGADEATATMKLLSRIFGFVLLLVGFSIVLIMLFGLFLTAQSLGQK